MTGADLIRQWIDACRSHVPRRPGPAAMPDDWTDLGGRIDAALAGAARQALDEAAEEIQAMPDFAGRTAREDGSTHRCAGCRQWMLEEATERGIDRLLRHPVEWRRPDGTCTVTHCGPVHDLTPMPGVLRGEAAAMLRGLDPATVLAGLHGDPEAAQGGAGPWEDQT